VPKLMVVFILVMVILNGCAVVHHVQVGDIDDRENVERFEVMLSETTISLPEATRIAGAFSRNQSTRAKYGKLANYIKLFQMGPSTGLGVFDEKYAEQLLTLITRICPNGKISGLTSIREMRRYPAISGEIVKVSGYCQKS
jgi:hypothetical protein